MGKPWAIVTGSSSGLGLAMSQHLIELGYNVAGGSRTGTELEHKSFYDFELDVSSEESVLEFYKTLDDLTEKVDLMVNNAGICNMATIDETSLDDFEKHLKINTLGSFLILKHAQDYILEGKTHIVSILSTGAKFGYPNTSAYNASKFALLGFLESLQKEWKPYRLKFTQLFPGAIDTPLWEKLPKEFSREKMLSIEDFLSVFDFVVQSPQELQLKDITFFHRDGFIQ